MIEIRGYLINGTYYILINETWGSYTRSWGHRTVISRGGIKLVENKVTYHNGTWEVYPFQTSMLQAINKLIDIQNKYKRKKDSVLLADMNSLKSLIEDTDVGKVVNYEVLCR